MRTRWGESTLTLASLIAALSSAPAWAQPGFLPNRGEYPAQVLCYGSLGRSTVFITSDGFLLNLHGSERPRQPGGLDEPLPGSKPRGAHQAVQVVFVNAPSLTRVTALDSLPLLVNRYHGQDPNRWLIGAHPWTRVRVDSPAWGGVIVSLGGDSLLVELADANRSARLSIGLRFAQEGTDQGAAGPVRTVPTQVGEITLAGKGDSKWVIRAAAARPGLSAEAGSPSQKSRANLLWATLLGGDGFDNLRALEIDQDQNPVVLGRAGLNFPITPGAYDSTNAGWSGFLARMDGRTGGPLWITYVGGSELNEFFGMAITPGNDVVVSGWTESADYPTTPGVYDQTLDASYAAAITNFDLPTGRLNWSTLLEGCWAPYVALASDGSILVAGATITDNLPTTPGVFGPTFSGDMDGVLAKLSPEASDLLWCTFFGSSNFEQITSVVVDEQDRAVIAGHAGPSPGGSWAGFPVTAGSYDTTFNGVKDYFVASIMSDAAAVRWCTFLGGAGGDYPYSLVIEDAGDVVVYGYTTSGSFPITNGIYTWPTGTEVCAISRLRENGQRLLASRVFSGGTASLPGNLLRLADGGFLLAGRAFGPSSFPYGETITPEPVLGNSDAFIVRFDQALTTLRWYTLVGGAGDDYNNRIARSGDGRVYLAGLTLSYDFPLTPGAYDTTHSSQEAFIVCLQGPAVPVSMLSLAANWGVGEGIVQGQLGDGARVQDLEVWRGAGAEERCLLGLALCDPSGRFVFADAGAPGGGALYWVRTEDVLGAEAWYGPVSLPPRGLPARLYLAPGSPNPFNPRTAIRFELPRAGRTVLALYDQRGRRVRTLVDGFMEAGYQSVAWDGSADGGLAVPAGVYFARLETEAGVRTSKLTLAK